jgi:hypothetical protein
MALPSLASIGSFASGLGSIASAFGLGKDDGPGFMTQLNDQRRAQHKLNMGQYNDIIKGSEMLGLHKSAMLGIPTNNGMTASYNSNNGFDFEALGQGVDRAANAGRTGVQRKLDDLAVEHAQLSNDYLAIQIAGAKKAITGTAAVPSLGRGSNRLVDGMNSDKISIVPDEVISKNSKDTGRSAGSHAAFKMYDLGYGQTMEAPMNDEGWAEAIGELPLWYKYPKMAEAVAKRTYGKYRGPVTDFVKRSYKNSIYKKLTTRKK